MMVTGGLASTVGTYNAYLGTTSSALRAQAQEGIAPAIFAALPQYKRTLLQHLFCVMRLALHVVSCPRAHSGHHFL